MRAGCRGSPREIAKLGVERDAERRQFPAAAFPAGRRARRRPTPTATSAPRGFVLRAVDRLRPAGLLAADGRRRGSEPRRRRGAGGVHGGRAVMTERLGPPLDAPLFDRLALIGVGLIGSSIARAARAARIWRGSSPSPTHSAEARERATALKLGDEVVADPAEAAAGADLVILCVPVGADEAVARAIAPKLKAGAIVSDVGSVKGAVIAAVGPHLPDGVASRARPSGRRHRAVRARRRLRDAVRQPLVHPDAARRRRPERRSPRCARSGRRLAPTSRR